MQAIKEIVSDVMQGLTTQKTKVGGDGPEVLLKKALSKKELQHIKFNYLRKGILNINVDSSSWLYHLGLKKEDLLARVNKECNKIKDIRFRIGEVE